MKVHIEKTIQLIRESFVGSEIVYKNGSCVKFTMILLHIYPKGKILYDLDHAIFEYENHYYDINGECKKGNHIPLEEYGLIQANTSMNLIYTPIMGNKEKKMVISRLSNAVVKHFSNGSIDKSILYSKRLIQVIENVI